MLIEHEDWRQRCEDDGIQRSRYKEARDALEKRRAIRLDEPLVFLLLEFVRNVRTPLGDSDAVETEPCGPLDASDTVNEEGLGIVQAHPPRRHTSQLLFLTKPEPGHPATTL